MINLILLGTGGQDDDGVQIKRQTWRPLGRLLGILVIVAATLDGAAAQVVQTAAALENRDLLRTRDPAESAATTGPAGERYSFAQQPMIRNARSALARGDLALARWHVNRAAGADSWHTEVIIARLLSELGRSADVKRVLELFSADPGHAFESHLAFAELAAQENRWFDAISHLDACQAADPPARWSPARLADVLQSIAILRGKVCEQRGDWQGAQQAYQAGRQLDPGNHDLAVHLARVSFQLGDPVTAMRYCKDVKLRDPSRSPPALLVAEIATEVGDETAAEKYFRTALQSREPLDRSAAVTSFADWLIARNRADEASEILNQGDRLSGRAKRQVYQQGLAARMQGDLESAKRDLMRLYDADPDSFAVSNQLALVLIDDADEGLRAKAVELAEANASKRPSDPEALATLGWIQFRLGNLESAAEMLTAAMQSATPSRDTAWYLSQVKERQGHVAAAKRLRELAENGSGPWFSAPK